MILVASMWHSLIDKMPLDILKHFYHDSHFFHIFEILKTLHLSNTLLKRSFFHRITLDFRNYMSYERNMMSYDRNLYSYKRNS